MNDAASIAPLIILNHDSASCDLTSAEWAFRLGCGTESRRGTSSGDELCPFDQGTPQAHYWARGHTGKAFKYVGTAA